MYSEMLREGWVTEDKLPGYYGFIHDESERLSRLIANVLRLARMTRNEQHLELRPVACGELMDLARSKVSSRIDGPASPCAWTARRRSARPWCVRTPTPSPRSSSTWWTTP